MSQSTNPAVIVFSGRNELEAQIARDVLLSSTIPILHLPSLSTGLFGVAQTTQVAVPREFAEAALAALQEAGLAGAMEEPPRGSAAFQDAVADRFPMHRAAPLPQNSSMRRVLVVLLVALVAWAAFKLFGRS